MPLQIEIDPTPLGLDADGTVRIARTRVSLENVLWLYKQGYGAEAIIEAFPSLALPDVHSVIAYYLRHRRPVDEYLQEREVEADMLRHQMEQEFGRGPTKTELLN